MNETPGCTGTTGLDRSAELYHLLEQICQQALEELDASGCILSTCDPQQDTFTAWVISSRREDNLSPNLPFETHKVYPLSTHAAMGRALREQAAVTIGLDDLAEPAERALLEAWGQKAMLVLPLVANQETVGLLSVFQDSATTFQGEDIRIAQALSRQAALIVADRSLFETTDPEARDLNTLLEASITILSTLNLENVLQAVAEQMARIVGVSGCAFYHWEEGTQTVRTWVAYGTDLVRTWPLDQPGATYSLEEYPLMARVLHQRTHATVRVDDSQADPAERARLERFGLKSILMLPVIAYGEIVALAELLEGQFYHNFTRREVNLAQTLANQAAIAIINARLYEQSRRRSTELAALFQVTTTIISSLDFQEVLNTLCREIVNLLHATSAYVCDWKEDQQATTAIAEYYSEAATRRERISDLGVTYTGESFVASFLQTGKPFAIKVSDPFLPEDEREYLQAYDGKSVLYIPLVYRNTVLGYLEIWESRYERDFTQEEILLGRNLASQAAIAIENARLYSRLQDQLENLQRAYEELRQTQDHLIKAQKLEAVGLLAAGVSHDFNNLLTIISLYTEQVLDELDESSPYYNNLAEVQQASLRAKALVRQLLLFSRQQPLTPKPLHLGAQIAQQMKILRPMLREDIVIRLDWADDLWPIYADSGAIEQVMINLVTNARDAMPHAGSLNLEVENVRIEREEDCLHPLAMPGPYVRLSFEDSGMGMDKETLKRIFDPFFTTKPPGKGTGLGLAVVHHIIDRHHGWVQVQSAPGEGTRFDFYLPAIVDSKIEDITLSKTQLRPSTEQRILLVEDSIPLRKALERALRTTGYTVLVAVNCAEAQSLLQGGERIDLLLSDVILPDGRGYHLANTLLSQHPHTPILLISGYLEEVEEWDHIFVQGYTFLPKPFSINQVLLQVHELLEDRPEPSP